MSNLVSLEKLKSFVEDKNTQQKNWENEQIEVVNEGTRIVLPETMEYPAAITALERKMKEGETMVRIHEEIDAFPLEGAYALCNVLKEIYGWASPVPTKNFMGQDDPPFMVNLEIDYEVFTQVFWGAFSMPGIDGRIKAGVTRADGRIKFVISGEVKKKCEKAIAQIAAKVREFIKIRSIYSGKAIRLKTDSKGKIDFMDPPRFIDAKNIRVDELVLPEGVEEQVQTSLFTPIEHTEACRRYSIPLKRGVLLEGPYGCGKTMTAYVTAKKCTENGWTFIYLDKIQAINEAFRFAKTYAPAVIFAEDIDRVTDGVRDMELDEILNQIDGIELKNCDVMTVLTTNHVENINKAMIRPGRLDAIIRIDPPDAKAAEKLIRIYSRGLIEEKEDLSSASEELSGQIPAMIRECVERAKLFSVSRQRGLATLQLCAEDILLAAHGMKHHLSLMDGEKKVPSTEETLGISFRDLVTEVVESEINELEGRLE